VLDGILGYPVEDHVVTIEYYRPRGDNKEAWDTVDLRGFLGQPMQLKLNFLCKDSILAAPLAVEIARTLDLARRRGDGGVQEQLGVFFKQPGTRVPGAPPEHGFPEQQRRLLAWLGGDPAPDLAAVEIRCRRVPSACRPTARRSPPRPPTARRRTGPPSHSSPRPRDTRRAAGARGPAADLRHVADPVAPRA
jgi:hypothetical protein